MEQTYQDDQEGSAEIEENELNRTETVQDAPERANSRRGMPEIIQLLIASPAARKELIRYVKAEFGFDITGIIEAKFGELADKRLPLEEQEMPVRELARNVYQMWDDGYSNSQIASYLGMFPTQVSNIMANRKKIERNIKKGRISRLPFLLRVLSYLRMYLRI